MDPFFNQRINTSNLNGDSHSAVGEIVETAISAAQRAAKERNGFPKPIGYPPPIDPRQFPSGEAGIRFAVPPEDLHASKYNAGASNPYYYMVFDEALRDSWQNALAMRRDGVISELMFHRQLATASLDWHLVPDDPKDKWQMAVVDQLQAIVQATSRFKILIITLLEDIHFGKYAAQTQFGHDKVKGKKRVVINNHTPVQGDKITFGYDGIPRVMVYGGAEILQKPEYASRTTQGTFGKSLSLEGEYFRDRFIISKFIPCDYDYIFEGDMALAAHGIGMRSRMYWTWNVRLDVQTWITDALQRVGANGMTLGVYDYGNYPAKSEMEQTIRNLVKDNYATVGATPGKKPVDMIINIPVSAVGYEVMIKIMEYLDGILRRAYLGQELTSVPSATGFGSGTASIQKSMFDNIVGFDSDRVGETLDNELLKPLIKYNTFEYRKREYRGSDLPFNIHFSFKPDSEEVQAHAETGKTLHEMGVDLDVDDVREKAGFQAPESKDQVLPGKPEEAAQRKGKEDGETPTADLSPLNPRKIRENRERTLENHEKDLSFYRKSLKLPDRNRGVNPSEGGNYPTEISRRDVSGILADQYGNILARERGMSAGEETKLDNRWISSNKFYLMEVPIDIAVPSHWVRPSDKSHSSGPLIIDANNRKIGGKFADFGFDMSMTVLDGKHRQAQWIREGKRTTLAYIGDKVVDRVKARIDEEGDRINERLEKFEAQLAPDVRIPEAFQKGHDGGVMICLKVPKAVAHSLPFGQPELEGEAHVTLAYLGNTDEIGRETIERAGEICELFAEHSSPISGKIEGLGRFEASESSEGREVIYAKVDVPKLDGMRKELIHVLGLGGVEFKNNHEFTPHVTLDYVEEGDDSWMDQEFEPVEVRFDSIALVVGGKWKYYYFK